MIVTKKMSMLQKKNPKYLFGMFFDVLSIYNEERWGCGQVKHGHSFEYTKGK
jgi:hypothetical protein